MFENIQETCMIIVWIVYTIEIIWEKCEIGSNIENNNR